ncbi:MAG: hypothetical protein AVDCRST_MAG16-2571, partial [uncultured Frankineae bacterium]
AHHEVRPQLPARRGRRRPRAARPGGVQHRLRAAARAHRRADHPRPSRPPRRRTAADAARGQPGRAAARGRGQRRSAGRPAVDGRLRRRRPGPRCARRRARARARRHPRGHPAHPERRLPGRWALLHARRRADGARRRRRGPRPADGRAVAQALRGGRAAAHRRTPTRLPGARRRAVAAADLVRPVRRAQAGGHDVRRPASGRLPRPAL